MVQIDPLVQELCRYGGVLRMWNTLIAEFRRQHLTINLESNRLLPAYWRRYAPKFSCDQIFVPTLLRPCGLRVCNIQIVHDCIKERHYRRWKRTVIRERRRLIYETATRLIAVSEATKAELGEIYGGRVFDKTTTILNPVDIVYVRSMANDDNSLPSSIREIQRGHRTAVYVGVRCGTKNFEEGHTLLAADKDCHLLVVGPPPTRAEIAQYAQYGGRVHYLGRMSDKQLFTLIRRSAFLFFPSKCEGFGLPIVEAMALGVRVLGLNTATNKEVGSGYVETFASGAVDDLRSLVLSTPQKCVETELNRFHPPITAKAYIKLFRSIETARPW